MDTIRPFHSSIPAVELEELRRRLNSTRWPSQETVQDWSQGVPLQKAKELCRYWAEVYDWRKCEKLLNSVGQYHTMIDAIDVHFLHIQSANNNALPMLMTHGWPGSVLEFHKVIGPLTDPAAHGGRPEDAFHLVIPSMPGYGFSSHPKESGWNLKRIAAAWEVLMARLGYKEWVAQGGDWGGDICAVLASHTRPVSLIAVHMNCAFFNPTKEIHQDREPTAQEQRALQMQTAFDTHEYGYFKLQATRPQTVAYGLADSPAAQATWIFEKIWAWSQHSGDVETVLSKDEILDNIMLYWLSNTGGSSARLYWEDDDGTDMPIDIPVGVSLFPGDLNYAPMEWGKRYYKNIIHWREVERGGHFAAWEVPDIFVREVRDCFRHVRNDITRK